VFADDIMEEHSANGSALCAEIGTVVDRALEDVDYTAVLGVVQHYTLKFLRLYEVSIMRMLQEASKLGDTIPLKYFGDLASPADRVPDAGEVHLSVRDSVRKAREFLADVRNETMDLGVAVAHNAPAAEESSKTDADAVADDAHNDCVPTVEELDAYLAFVNYHASDENALANAVARIQTAVHVVEPKEIVEGISVADVQEEVAAESAVGTTEAHPDSSVLWDMMKKTVDQRSDAAPADAPAPTMIMTPHIQYDCPATLMQGGTEVDAVDQEVAESAIGEVPVHDDGTMQ
jgi:hypothetical protein